MCVCVCVCVCVCFDVNHDFMISSSTRAAIDNSPLLYIIKNSLTR